jgi:DNA-binding MarR family transcriptional regulator
MREDEYIGCLAGHLRAATRLITREYDFALRPHGMRITQVAILAQLAHVQPVTVTAFAAGLASDRSAVARDLAILERGGLVVSQADADDQRARRLSLTPAGRRKLAECAPAWRAVQSRMRERVGAADVAELIKLSDRVVGALS